ncbi:hypothetical protein EOK76_g1900 [Lacticaseibacillus paracasei]|nr:hypothetical protein EOK76_g1900 [Lacticaseibacillus paracasei]
MMIASLNQTSGLPKPSNRLYLYHRTYVKAVSGSVTAFDNQ